MVKHPDIAKISLLGTNLCFPRFSTVVTAAQEIKTELVACILKYSEPHCCVAQLWKLTNAKPLTGWGSSYKTKALNTKSISERSGLVSTTIKKNKC